MQRKAEQMKYIAADRSQSSRQTRTRAIPCWTGESGLTVHPTRLIPTCYRSPVAIHGWTTSWVRQSALRFQSAIAHATCNLSMKQAAQKTKRGSSGAECCSHTGKLSNTDSAVTVMVVLVISMAAAVVSNQYGSIS
eukprot:scpid14110/ scgid16740/ 